jgi:hypothetical protein
MVCKNGSGSRTRLQPFPLIFLYMAAYNMPAVKHVFDIQSFVYRCGAGPL